MPCEELRKQPRVWGRSRARRFLLWAYEWRSVRSLIARLTLATCDELVPGRARSPSTNQCRPEAAQKYRIHDSMDPPYAATCHRRGLKPGMRAGLYTTTHGFFTVRC